MSESLLPRGSRQPNAAPNQPADATAQPATPSPQLEPSPATGEGANAGEDLVESAAVLPPLPRPPRHGKRLAPPDQARRADFSPQQRLLILDAWLRSGLPARDFAPLVGL